MAETIRFDTTEAWSVFGVEAYVDWDGDVNIRNTKLQPPQDLWVRVDDIPDLIGRLGDLYNKAIRARNSE